MKVETNLKAPLRAKNPNRAETIPNIRSGHSDQDGGEKKEGSIPLKKIDPKTSLLDALPLA
jgi:hypothetical protein